LYPQGLDDEYQEEGKLLGDYTYQDDGESLQIFPVMVKYIHTEFADVRCPVLPYRVQVFPGVRQYANVSS